MPPTFLEDIQPQVLWTSPCTYLGFLTGLSPSMVGRSRPLKITSRHDGGQTLHLLSRYRVGFSLPCAAFDRLYSRHRYCFLFLRLLRCFNSAGSPSLRNCPKAWKSYSEILGSTVACTYPRLIATCYVLLRRLEPSHSPNGVATLAF